MSINWDLVFKHLAARNHILAKESFRQAKRRIAKQPKIKRRAA